MIQHFLARLAGTAVVRAAELPILAEEASLVARARGGDEEAFRVLVETYQAPAYRWALERVRNPEDALDVVQEAFVRVFRSLDRFDSSRRFATWLYRIVANLAIDQLRRRRSQRVTASTEDLPEPVDLAAASWLDEAERAERIRAVRRCLDRLPPIYREVLLLRDIEGVAARDIAGLVGVTHATVRWRLHQARKLFRDVWERLEGSPVNDIKRDHP